MENKPPHAKPQLYACYFSILKEIAKKYGYNLVVHGSMNRDLDLVAIPWAEELGNHVSMIQEFVQTLGGSLLKESSEKRLEQAARLHGRMIYVIDLNRGGYKRNEKGEIVDPIEFTPDPEYYIDISVMPTGVSTLSARNNMINLLENYSKFLAEHGYMDEDWRSEPPYAIDEFLKLTDGTL